MKKANLLSIVPLVPAIEMEKTIAFYTEQLGFNNHIRDGEPLTYAGLKNGNVEFHLYKTSKKYLCDWSVIRIETNNINDHYEKYKKREFLHPNGKLELKNYGLKEFSLLDPNGVLVTFFERT
ncbi:MULTISPECIES: hypothetical protein [Metabacillus]|uniref:VOC domain-containing protein n=3 Tax=Metabacillus TaxID=2675233 RepID=A0A179T5D0_9BACI|nr:MULTISPECIES: hypothetical protein [Metabacillus]OAS87813.1 hypothetical protein A6K24_18935 [Metabacillus litoralis]QNF27314.1 VOC family protein [Metabacillus sp. KUDC1714]